MRSWYLLIQHVLERLATLERHSTGESFTERAGDPFYSTDVRNVLSVQHAHLTFFFLHIHSESPKSV